MFMGLVLEVASCSSLYKNLFNGVLVFFMLNGLGPLRRILYFHVQTGTRTTLFNGGLVVYVFDFGAFSRFFTSAYK